MTPVNGFFRVASDAPDPVKEGTQHQVQMAGLRQNRQRCQVLLQPLMFPGVYLIGFCLLHNLLRRDRLGQKGPDDHNGIWLYLRQQKEDVAAALNIVPPTIRNWLKKYDCKWKDFQTISLAGENPLDYYHMKEHIYEPDLTPRPAKHFTNYVQRNKASTNNPWRIVKDAKYYGSYPTREIADKISNELQKTGWSKENLERIRKKEIKTTNNKLLFFIIHLR